MPLNPSQTDVLIVNQTSDTLQDLTIEFATLGDLKLVERPAPHTLGPNAFHNIKATIKVSSTETGVIFGNVVYDRQGGADTSVNIVLNDVHVDIMDYIKPAYVNEAQVRVERNDSSAKSLKPFAYSSAACGPNSNGRTRSTSTRRSGELNEHASSPLF